MADNYGPSPVRGPDHERLQAFVGKWHAEGPLITHGVIGYDAKTADYFIHAFENHGYQNRYVGGVDGRIWTFTGERERVRIVFSDDGRTRTITWEWRPHDDEWLPLCDQTNIRVD
jgi:hypothetical protein